MRVKLKAALVAQRLRAVMREFKLVRVEELAKLCGAERGAVSNWINGYALPPVHYMIELRRKTGVTLDWIYAGNLETLPGGLGIRLASIMDGLEPPDVSPEPDCPRHCAAASPQKGTKAVAVKKGQKTRGIEKIFGEAR